MAENISITRALHENRELSLRDKLSIVVRLSIPTMLAMVSEIIMQYIDSAMVGQLGANESASIGLVASSTWLVGGLITALASGFSVQIAHAVGANDNDHARSVFRQAILFCTLFSLIPCVLCLLISPYLPLWLQGDSSIRYDAMMYFGIYAAFIPVRVLYYLFEHCLQCTGNMKTPSLLGVVLCLSDIVFNYFLIFPSRTVSFFGISLPVYRAGLGVTGAALGTAFSYVFAGILMGIAACVHSPVLSLRRKGSWRIEKNTLNTAARIAIPMGAEQAAVSLAQVMSTRIIAPLGNIAVAANSFAVTAEAFCYMPGYGIASASTTLVGQSIGAKRRDLAKSFARLTTVFGMALMAVAGIIMYFISPSVFAFLTPSAEVQTLGIQVLRVELLAEPMFAASIVVTGALRGAGDTLIPGIINLVSMWGVRLTLASVLVPKMGLMGLWAGMCIELNCRGLLYLIRLRQGKWLDKALEG